jgi:tRNA pseudouridine13 synthase
MLNLPEIKLSLPYITQNFEGIRGKIKAKSENFIVEEVPLYNPSGNGNHIYINVTKKNKTTREVQIELAKLFELNPDQVGKAGLKDKKAITTQTFSIMLGSFRRNMQDISELIENDMDIKVNWVKPHKHKLRTGHLKGNSFKVEITDLENSIDVAYKRALKIIERIHLIGMPNYYGEQRIGYRGENAISGWKILSDNKRIKDIWLRKYLISSYQSYLCNRYLTHRIQSNFFFSLINGDIAQKHDTGGSFIVENIQKEQPRFVSKEISFTAPIFGYKMLSPSGESLKLEKQILSETCFDNKTWRKNKIKGTRRIGRLLPNIKIKKTNATIILSFFLPKGGFATVLLREFIKNNNSFELN